MENVPPVLLSAIICNRVLFDKVSSMPSIIDIIQNINSPKFPVRYGQLVFFCELTDGHGLTKLKIRLVDIQNDEKVIFEKDGPVEFSDVKQVLTLALNLQNIVFPQPGEYRFQLFAEEKLLGERKIICRKVELPQQPQGPINI